MNKVTGSILTVSLGFVIGSCLFGLGIRYAREHGKEVYNKDADAGHGLHIGPYYRTTFTYYEEMDSAGHWVRHSKAAEKYFNSDYGLLVDSLIHSKQKH